MAAKRPYWAFQKLNARRAAEKRLKKSNPAVKDAWEKYQVVLNLALEEDKLIAKDFIT